MGNWDKIKVALGIPDDSDVVGDREDNEGTAAEIHEETIFPKKETAYSSKAIPAASAREQVNMVIVKSTDYSNARSVADHILNRRGVLLNLENCNKEMAQRILDFLSGVVYAQGGDLQRIAHSTYAVTPKNVGLQGELAEEPKEEEF